MPHENFGFIFSRESYYGALYFGEKKKGWQLTSLIFWNFKRYQLLLWGLFLGFNFWGLKQRLYWPYARAGPILEPT